MQEQLIARREEAEKSFSTVQNSINLIKQELEKYKVESVGDLEAELLRLQGEYRAIGDLLEKTKDTKPKKVSPKADVIDATTAEGA